MRRLQTWRWTQSQLTRAGTLTPRTAVPRQLDSLQRTPACSRHTQPYTSCPLSPSPAHLHALSSANQPHARPPTHSTAHAHAHIWARPGGPQPTPAHLGWHPRPARPPAHPAEHRSTGTHRLSHLASRDPTPHLHLSRTPKSLTALTTPGPQVPARPLTCRNLARASFSFMRPCDTR